MAKKVNKTASKTVKSTKSNKNDLVKNVRKRNGTVVPFDLDRIVLAIHKAMLASSEGSEVEASMVANKVFADLVRTKKKHSDFVPTVEGINDTVERELILSEYVNTARAFILYRNERSKIRAQGVEVPERIKKLTEESKKNFKNALGEFIYYRTYSRWIPEEGRRETWVETVDRYVNFMKEDLGNKLTKKEYDEVRDSILKQEAMPSMRLLQFAGPAARKTNVCAYNCSFIAPASVQDFAEVMYLSMCGTGVGFSIESRNVQKLPMVQKQSSSEKLIFVIPDSREGWADSLAFGMKAWFEGKDVEFDYSQLRPAGARLQTMGGKSSGPEPLRNIHQFTREKILSRQGKRLRNIDAHDIVCKIGEGVVAGGVRRTALISLSDLDDEEVRDAKKGQFWLTEPQRALSNNSAVYEEKPSNEDFLEEWLALIKSQSGERGIFNRGNIRSTAPERRMKQWAPGEDPSWGTNPCGEIILQSKQFCNLSEIVARKGDTEKDLLRKMKVAAILGTYQSSLTDFSYLSKEWKKNCEQERLLGVSITGQWDCDAARDVKVLKKLKEMAVRHNKAYAKRFGISQSMSVTCVKPSGTVAQMVDASSGMHPRHSEYYIRRVRISATDSLFKMLRDQGVPFNPEVGQSLESAHTYVIDFPVKAPEKSVFQNDLTAPQQLEHWKDVKTSYTEHNPSVTISVGNDEWLAVANWLYENWEIIGGLSFLPRNDHVYQLAPFESIDKNRYDELLARWEHVDFGKIMSYEMQDETDVKKELACVGGVCDIDDLLAKEANSKK